MNKKLPKVFANRIDKNILNNEKIYYSGNSDKIESNAQKDNFDNKNIYQKINDILIEKYDKNGNLSDKSRVEFKLYGVKIKE